MRVALPLSRLRLDSISGQISAWLFHPGERTGEPPVKRKNSRRVGSSFAFLHSGHFIRGRTPRHWGKEDELLWGSTESLNANGIFFTAAGLSRIKAELADSHIGTRVLIIVLQLWSVYSSLPDISVCPWLFRSIQIADCILWHPREACLFYDFFKRIFL